MEAAGELRGEDQGEAGCKVTAVDGLRVTIDGLELSTPESVITIEPGTTVWDAVSQLGGAATVEHVPYVEEGRTVTAEAAAFLHNYKYEDDRSALAVFWCYGSLEAEEFDTVEEAERYLTGSEEYGSLAGEAIVDEDGEIRVWR